MKTNGKAAANKKQKKDALLSTAFELFTLQGIQNTSIADIAERAGVAKGTFYLYFKDKYDIRNRLIARKASALFAEADAAVRREGVTGLEDQIIYIADFIIDRFTTDRVLLGFISKNLSWGIFKSQVLTYSEDEEIDMPGIIREAFAASHLRFKDPEVMLFMITELLSSTCYSAILYEEPLPIGDLKPYLYGSIRAIMRSMEVPDEA